MADQRRKKVQAAFDAERGDPLPLAAALNEAFRKYWNAFGEPMHGTTKQIAAAIELAGGLNKLLENSGNKRGHV